MSYKLQNVQAARGHKNCFPNLDSNFRCDAGCQLFSSVLKSSFLLTEHLHKDPGSLYGVIFLKVRLARWGSVSIGVWEPGFQFQILHWSGLVNLFEAWFLHLWNGGNSSFFKGSQRLNEIVVLTNLVNQEVLALMWSFLSTEDLASLRSLSTL